MIYSQLILQTFILIIQDYAKDQQYLMETPKTKITKIWKVILLFSIFFIHDFHLDIEKEGS